ncbi:hypothetical protein G7054_g4653 [Neopestalotiopsis clavispora]|nr:hypothetical protein G7054_g4653 [Neopestalotiopsis clavispora]
MNGRTVREPMSNQTQDELMQLTLQLKNKKENDKKYAKFHGDNLIGDPIVPKIGSWGDMKAAFQPKNWPALKSVADGFLKGSGLDGVKLEAGSSIIGSLSDYSVNRQNFINDQVKSKYDKMLHPPLTYLGDAFQYRTADGKFNSAINPHLGQAGAPYAKTVPSKTAQLGALPDPSDLFDKLMARGEGGRVSQSGLSAMLLYHATIIIHDIFRTNEKDKNISDSSSYLDLSPLYGYTEEMQRKVRDDKYKLGLLKPDTFAEDRLLRQPPGVCIMLVMYNRYHNYAARQLLRINENGRFKVPRMYEKTKLVSLIQAHLPDQGKSLDDNVKTLCKEYEKDWRATQAAKPGEAPKALKELPGETEEEKEERQKSEEQRRTALDLIEKFKKSDLNKKLIQSTEKLELRLQEKKLKLKDESPEQLEGFEKTCQEFEAAWEAAWKKQDDDLFNTARLITCGMYIQISVHDYLRALMGFHQFNTNFTLDPRADFDQKKTSRGIGNQVTVEFNLLYRFHCAISRKDEDYTIDYMKDAMHFKEADFKDDKDSLSIFMQRMGALKQKAAHDKERGKNDPEPWEVTFGIPDPSGQDPANDTSGRRPSENGSDSGVSMSDYAGAETSKQRTAPPGAPQHSRHFARNKITNLFDDQQMVDELNSAMDDPLSNFGPRNVPRCLKAVEIMGIQQARRWECGTLNDFRDFFGLPRHETFESVSKNVDIQDALRDLYEHPDKIELYPGIFCESDEYMGLDPGPSESSSALWSAIFSDAITLVRSDRFYTVDWNTNSLTSWGMKEVTPNNEICKSSVFHRLIQRAFPGWFPNDTIRFFHPFYTGKQNAMYAEAQGYGARFRETVVESANQSKNPGSDVIVKRMEKPVKPWYFATYNNIDIILQAEKKKKFKNPVYDYEANLPKVVNTILNSDTPDLPYDTLHDSLDGYIKDVEVDLKKYLGDLMKFIIKRESVSMTNSAFQIDATRDFAIPVVTRYIADFLGFADKLRQVPTEDKNTYSENEIYQHITNCQVFLSYNADETKWMQRRQAFKESMRKLIDLTQNGTIWEADQWDITRAFFGKRKTNPMHELGVFVAKQVLSYEKDQRRAAAILLLVCLDFAYNAVVSFTATLNGYMKELYDAAYGRPIKGSEPEWIQVQRCAMDNDDKTIERMVQVMAQKTIRLPIVRKAKETASYTFEVENDAGTTGKKTFPAEIKEDKIVILDVSKAMSKLEENGSGEVEVNKVKIRLLASQLSIADKYAAFSPRRFADISLTSMIKFFAQMRNTRRGHDAQGHLKRIHLDGTVEGYANYMAPMRVNWIREQIKHLDKEEAEKILTDYVLKPETDTYLTPTWDELVPFPMTWKIRFDGFGTSEYGPESDPYSKLRKIKDHPDSMPPWYQPQGPSTVGGTFADVVCVCAEEKAKTNDGDAKDKPEPRTSHMSLGCSGGL